jgi:UDP-N-acetyl-D-galactosamine dehydrogenase
MRRIAVIGLGYVGLPVALAFARRFAGTIGFDVDRARIAALREGRDATGQVPGEELRRSSLQLSADPAELRAANLYVVTVPTPIDAQRRPDLAPLEAASRTVGAALAPGDLVVFESTVYPGVTEEICGPILARASGLVSGRDFKLGYSPERINPGDPEHRFERIAKVVAAEDEDALEELCRCYGAVVDAEIHRAPSIRVAEAAKVIENVQRDLNIALMNELAIIFDRLGIDTRAVLDAAATKWNFHRYRPGLVGGHCIGVDPYYLTSKAEEVGIHPQVILAGRRINDGMGAFVAARTIKLLSAAGRGPRGARVGVLGLAFKAGVADIRNSRVPDVVRELEDFGVEVRVHDPLADPAAARAEYGIELARADELTDLDAVVLAVAHDGLDRLAVALVAAGAAIVVDATGAAALDGLRQDAVRWRL